MEFTLMWRTFNATIPTYSTVSVECSIVDGYPANRQHPSHRLEASEFIHNPSPSVKLELGYLDILCSRNPFLYILWHRLVLLRLNYRALGGFKLQRRDIVALILGNERRSSKGDGRPASNIRSRCIGIDCLISAMPSWGCSLMEDLGIGSLGFYF